MKTLHKYFWGLMMLSATALLSCEKNDPFAELGEVVGEGKVPFVTIANMGGAYPAGDTIDYNVFYWSTADDIDRLALRRGEMAALKGSLTIDDGAGAINVELDTLFENEISQLGADLTHDPLDYETARNAYNKFMGYTISPEYQLLEVEYAQEESGDEEQAEMKEALATVNGLAFSEELKTAIMAKLKANGARSDLSWENLGDVVTSIDLAIESTLTFQVRVFNEKGGFKDSAVRNVAVGAILED